MAFIGQTLQVIGEVLIGVTALMVHRRVWKEHKMNPVVYKEMEREQLIGVLGVILLITGYILQTFFSK